MPLKDESTGRWIPEDESGMPVEWVWFLMLLYPFCAKFIVYAALFAVQLTCKILMSTFVKLCC